jgi:hypothetical protein
MYIIPEVIYQRHVNESKKVGLGNPDVVISFEINNQVNQSKQSYRHSKKAEEIDSFVCKHGRVTECVFRLQTRQGDQMFCEKSAQRSKIHPNSLSIAFCQLCA